MMPDVTFTINGLPYTLGAQAYTLMVRLWPSVPPPPIPICWVRKAAPETKVAQSHPES